MIDAGGDLTFRAGTEVKVSGADSLEVNWAAGGDLTARKMDLMVSLGGGDASVSLEAGDVLDLKGFDLSVGSYPGSADVQMWMVAGSDIFAPKALFNAYSSGTDGVSVRSENGDLLFKGGDFYTDNLSLETCHSERGGCGTVIPLLDVRNTHYRASTSRFCVDGGDVSDATDVDVKKSRKATLNGC